MRKETWFLLGLCLLYSASLCAEQTTDKYCELDPNLEYWEAWQQCESQRVKITGEMADFPMQHPTGLHDTFNPMTGQRKKLFEHYLEVDNTQIVITSSERIECSGAIGVDGIVDIVDLGGKKGKSSYKNVWIKLKYYTCL